MSANAPLLTDASKLAAEQSVNNYSAGVAAHINGDFGKHVQLQVINKNWVDSCGNVIPGSKRLRILATVDGVSVAVVLPLLPFTSSSVSGAPLIVKQPVSATVAHGASVSFKIGVTGAPIMRYQWRHDGVNIPGAVSAQFAVTNAIVPNAGIYDCIVKNGQGVVVSRPATLSVAVTGSFTEIIPKESGGFLDFVDPGNFFH